MILHANNPDGGVTIIVLCEYFETFTRMSHFVLGYHDLSSYH